MTRGYDADWFRNALIGMEISPCIPSRIDRKVPIPHDAGLYRQRGGGECQEKEKMFHV